MAVAIWWIRRDLRLSDNLALSAAIETGAQLIPVFILDPKLIDSSNRSTKRLSFLYANLRSLDTRLRERGSRLIVRKGDPIDQLSKLCSETNGSPIYAEPDFTPYAHKRDQAIAEILPIHWAGSPLVHSPGSLLTIQGKPYTVFTPFGRAWKMHPPPSREAFLPSISSLEAMPDIDSLPIPDIDISTVSELFPPGEENALHRLSTFASGSNAPIYRYQELRNRPDLQGTSQLSPYLRFGILSARQVVLQALRAIENAPDRSAQSSAESWLNELIWREFYSHILYYFPESAGHNFRFPELNWQNNQQDFKAWCEGRTGYPFVDAAMRQLVATGWIHNRLRMVVASFLTKDLLIYWKWGARYFMQHLIDGDPASNTGGWQWTAGTGTDAAPYFRIFNPISQSKQFDPEGYYIRRWLPELADLPKEFIHEPWKMPIALQEKSHCQIGIQYPAPIIDHSFARQRTLHTFRNIR